MVIKRNVTVGSIAASMPEALPVFQKLGIDFCCGGKNRLRRLLQKNT